MNARELYRSGQLNAAIEAAKQEVKASPGQAAARFQLAELLCFAGETDKADAQLDTIGQLDSTAMVRVAMFRQLLRGEQARRQFYEEGRLPEFLTEPSPELRLRLEASIALREGRIEEAGRILRQAEQQRIAVSGASTEQPFDDLRDMDDLTASLFEVLTSTGKYYWIPFDRVELVEFHPPATPRELLWRRVHMIVRDGPDGEVFLPVLYYGSHADPDDRVRLGRATNWLDDGGVVRGRGQRTLLVGDADVPIMELAKLELQPAPQAPELQTAKSQR